MLVNGHRATRQRVPKPRLAQLLSPSRDRNCVVLRHNPFRMYRKYSVQIGSAATPKSARLLFCRYRKLRVKLRNIPPCRRRRKQSDSRELRALLEVVSASSQHCSESISRDDPLIRLHTHSPQNESRNRCDISLGAKFRDLARSFATGTPIGSGDACRSGQSILRKRENSCLSILDKV